MRAQSTIAASTASFCFLPPKAIVRGVGQPRVRARSLEGTGECSHVGLHARDSIMRPPRRVKQLLLEARGTITTKHTIISGWKHRWWVFRRVALETIWAFLHHLQESPGPPGARSGNLLGPSVSGEIPTNVSSVLTLSPPKRAVGARRRRHTRRRVRARPASCASAYARCACGWSRRPARSQCTLAT